jgi:hypothetical protein
MNNQFATQHLLEEMDPHDSLRNAMRELGAAEDSVEVLVKAIEMKALTPSEAVEILKKALSKNEESAVGGGVTGGPTAATFTPGAGEQVAGTKKAFKKKYQEDAPRLAGDPSKTNKQGSKNLSGYSSVGFTKAPNAEEAGKKLKSIDVDMLWKESLEESRAYSKFKKEAATRSKDQQMHEAVKMIHSRLAEVSKILEYAQQMRAELSEGEQTLEYNHNTKKMFERINSKVVEIYSKTRQLK